MYNNIILDEDTCEFINNRLINLTIDERDDILCNLFICLERLYEELQMAEDLKLGSKIREYTLASRLLEDIVFDINM